MWCRGRRWCRSWRRTARRPRPAARHLPSTLVRIHDVQQRFGLLDPAVDPLRISDDLLQYRSDAAHWHRSGRHVGLGAEIDEERRWRARSGDETGQEGQLPVLRDEARPELVDGAHIGVYGHSGLVHRVAGTAADVTT